MISLGSFCLQYGHVVFLWFIHSIRHLLQTGFLQQVVGGVDSPSKHTSHSPSMLGGLFVNLCVGGWRYTRSSEEEDGSSLAVEVEGVLSVEEEEEEEEDVAAAAVAAEEEEEEVVAAVEEEEPAVAAWIVAVEG